MSMRAWKMKMNDIGRPDAGAYEGEVVAFRNERGTLSVGSRGDGLFELVLSVDGEELTVYELDAETIAAIGRTLSDAARVGD
jgi:hypothetical protein